MASAGNGGSRADCHTEPGAVASINGPPRPGAVPGVVWAVMARLSSLLASCDASVTGEGEVRKRQLGSSRIEWLAASYVGAAAFFALEAGARQTGGAAAAAAAGTRPATTKPHRG